jgi:hypothetical protein
MAHERSTADWYRAFAELEARGQSAVFEEWAAGVAADQEVLDLIDGLPLQKRQPNLVFAVARLLGAPIGDYPHFRDWLVVHWPAVAAEAAVRRTQTNEPRRCAALLPVLGLLGGPLALLELGASAGLCLYPDRYSYHYDDGEGDGEQGGDGVWRHPVDGPSPVRIDSIAHGPVPLPDALPEIVWRAGVDLEPLDVRSEEDVLWLETLVWPEQAERLARIRAAIGVVRVDPPRILRGDAIDQLPGLAAQAPAGATLVVVTSAMLVYLPYRERMALVEAIRALGAHWVSLDGVGVLPEVDARHPDARPGLFTLSLDGEPLANVGPHGQFVDWLV